MCLTSLESNLEVVIVVLKNHLYSKSGPSRVTVSAAFTVILTFVLSSKIIFSHWNGWAKIFIKWHFRFGSYEKLKTLYLCFHKAHNHQTWKCADLGWRAPTYKVTSMSLWSCGHVMWQNIIGPTNKVTSTDNDVVTWTLQLHFHNAYKHQTWYSGDLTTVVTATNTK